MLFNSPFLKIFMSVGRDGLLQVFQVDIDPPQMIARTLEKDEDFRLVC